MSEEVKEKKPRPRGKKTGSIHKRKGSRYWWISYWSNGKRIHESSNSERKSDAQDLLTDRIGDVQRGVPVTAKMGKITLAAGLAAVVNDMRLNNRTTIRCERDGCRTPCCDKPGHTNAIQRQIDNHILKYFKSDRLMSTIATSDLTAYSSHRMNEGAAAATVCHELATIRRAFRLAVRGKELHSMPHVPMLTLNNARTGFFERHELDAILKHLPDYLHAPLKFAFCTGWRFKSEVLPLTADRVDLKAGVVRLDVGTTKNRDGRTFYLTAELRDVLTTQLAALDALKQQDVISPYVFHRPDGSLIKDFRALWTKACTDAGYPNKLLHDFRRTAVRTLERSGVPRSTAMAMVGHKTEAIYRRYAIVDEAMHREAAAKLDAWAEAQKKATAPPKGKVKRFKKAGLKSIHTSFTVVDLDTPLENHG